MNIIFVWKEVLILYIWELVFTEYKDTFKYEVQTLVKLDIKIRSIIK